MSGGYGRGGYPGQEYPEPEYEGDPRQQRGSGGPGGPGGPGPGGQGGPGYGGYNGPNQGQRPGPGGPGGRRGPQGRDPRGHDPRGGYDQQQGSGAYRQQGTGGYPQQGSGGYPQQGTGGYRQQGGGPQYDQGPYDGQYDQGPRGPQGRDPRRRGPRDGYDQRGGHQDQRWGSDEDQTSFMPGFGGGRGDNGRDGYDDGRRGYDDGRGDFDDNRGRGRDRGRGDFDDGGRGNFGDSRRGDFDDDRSRGSRNRDDWDDDLDRKPRKKVTRWFPRILVMATVAVVLIGGGVGAKVVYGKYEARYHPPDFTGAGTGSVVFQVKSGDTAFSVAPELLADGVVASTRALENAATAAAATSSAGLEPGYYKLHKQEQASLVWQALSNPKNAMQDFVTIPEGERTADVLTTLAGKTKIPLSQFQAAAKETSKLGLPSYATTTAKLPSTVPYGQIEGFLFPDTYPITPHETALQILQAMVAAYNANAQSTGLTAAATKIGMTPRDVIIEASMVQAEAGSDAEMPDVASVFDNRKAAGMADGSVAVVGYGLGLKLLNIPTDLNPETAGAYDNTQDPGLPPTAIDNPGNAAINAVLNPAKTDFLYFLAQGPGKPTKFSHICQDLPGTC